MLDPARSDPSLLQPVDIVVTELLAKATLLTSNEVMVVGANCRDLIQSALGHAFALRATADIDLGLAIASWAAYDELAEALPPAGNTGIRFWIANTSADLLPFGPVERPPGTVTPPARREAINVWGFTEVFAASLELPLPHAGTIRIPTVAGYAALKLAAWLDRSAYGEYKDATDIATALYWYLRSPDVATQLYETDPGQNLLIEEGLDDSAAAARALGEDIARTVGPVRLSEILERWASSPKSLLHHYMSVTNASDWPRSSDRRRELVEAMERGLTPSTP
ncbi:putative nucleotidyltransferase [Actinoplanes tereljensis]|uniref:Nucleotidyltransferase n=1 Tax=Paractinoplanes tereljensis TaxID=571912 RepID=A0A919NK45_9ACTN|nr:hypothetical protein [Actinoplanes tereljensis]GIF19152.1 hypothetical protein Ate02nite_18820 [Actinoplanes tereljensis]